VFEGWPGEKMKDMGGRRKVELAEGVVTRVNTARNKFSVKLGGEERIKFKYRPRKFRVRLDGEEANSEDIGEGQHAIVGFIKVTASKKDVEQNLARSITIRAEGHEDTDEDTIGAAG